MSTSTFGNMHVRDDVRVRVRRMRLSDAQFNDGRTEIQGRRTR